MTDKASPFSCRGTRNEIEEGTALAPKFDRDGLIPAIATDAQTGEVLMLAYMNAQSLARTIATGEAHYWSRSRGQLWHKGATSGHIQTIVDLRIDCDQDAIWIKVEQGGGGCCHVGYKSCFFRSVPLKARDPSGIKLEFRESEKAFDPEKTYGKQG